MNTAKRYSNSAMTKESSDRSTKIASKHYLMGTKGTIGNILS